MILWAGIGELQKLLVIFIGSVFQIILMIAVNVGNTRRDLVEAAYTLGAGDSGIIRRVLLPSSAAEIAEILRLVLGWAWTYVIVAELIGSSSGIGHMKGHAIDRAIDALGGAEMSLQIFDFEQRHLDDRLFTGSWPFADRAHRAGRRPAG